MNNKILFVMGIITIGILISGCTVRVPGTVNVETEAPGYTPTYTYTQYTPTYTPTSTYAPTYTPTYETYPPTYETYPPTYTPTYTPEPTSTGPTASIGTTLAFDDGNVVTIQYSQNYFCNSPGPVTSPTSSPCIIGVDAIKQPVPGVTEPDLNSIIPAFLGTSTKGGINDPTLGANNFAQCPDTTKTLKCINHPEYVADATGAVSPVPIHSHIISGFGKDGWWKLNGWEVTDPTIWPDPKTGSCSAGSGCLTSKSALEAAKIAGKVKGPVVTNVYIFFNVVNNSNDK